MATLPTLRKCRTRATPALKAKTSSGSRVLLLDAEGAR
jgi:hypothetical protein